MAPVATDTSAPRKPETNRLQYLDALRGIAALMMVFFHFVLPPTTNFGENGRTFITIISDYMDLGRIGVVVFFAISGFIIPTSLNHRSLHPVRKFLISRLFRLYPLYWVSIILCIAVAGTRHSAYTIVANFTMIQGFLMAPEINGAAWTLAIELIFYAACLGLFLVNRLHERRIQFALVVGSLVLALVLAALRSILVRKFPVALPMVLAMMFFGTLWRGVVLDGDRLARRYAGPAIAILIIMIPVVSLLADRVDFGFHEWPVPYIFSYATGLAAFMLVTAKVRRCPAWLAYLGTISYSTYLLHTPVMNGATALGWGPSADASPLSNWLWVGLLMVAVVGISDLTYRWIEKPCVALGRRLERAVKAGPVRTT
jgi:peptidoglycan/LPS O-acetylase OafA/YrhL